jgi:hypothetical protein
MTPPRHPAESPETAQGEAGESNPCPSRPVYNDTPGGQPGALLALTDLQRTAPIVFTVPVKTVSGMNARENHYVRARRVKTERNMTAYRIPPALKGLGPFLEVRLVRVSRGELDDDAVPAALKAVRDQVAVALRVEDNTRLVRWTYAQEKGEAGVRVEVRRVE